MNSPITRRCAALLALSALAVAGTSNAPASTVPSAPSYDQRLRSRPSQDPRSPDARASATANGPSPDSVSSGHDLRSPDTRDAASGFDPKPVPVGTTRDLRSPDTRDVAIGYDPEPVAVALPEPSGSGERFDWVTAAIGGAAVGGLMLLLFDLSIGRGGVGRIGRRGALHP